MIRFDFFESNDNYQCHFNFIGSFVVSIAHYMRAYFNYEALSNGQDFQLPGDAGYLNVSTWDTLIVGLAISEDSMCIQCVLLQETEYSDTKLYAKIGCMERETFTSTKLQLHVYTDEQCSVPYEDGESGRYHSSKGYEINGYYFSTRVSFRPPFYSCQGCTPEAVSGTFNKRNGNWYDDDYISQHGKKQGQDDDDGEGGDGNDDDDLYGDDYFNDDQYMNANDDVGRNDDGNNNNNNNAANDDGNNGNNQGYNFNDDYYGDDGNRALRQLPRLSAAPGQLEVRNSVADDSVPRPCLVTRVPGIRGRLLAAGSEAVAV